MGFSDQNIHNLSSAPDSYFSNKSFKKLFEEYYSRLCYFSYQFVGSKASAEDIVQDAFIKFWNQREEVSSHAIAVKSFLYTTVRNASLNYIRHEKVAFNYQEKQDNDPLDDFDVVHTLIRAEVLAEIHKAIEQLPASCKRISKMGYLEGMKNKEIAEKLGISINTVKTQKQRALQLLRLLLKPDAVLALSILERLS